MQPIDHNTEYSVFILKRVLDFFTTSIDLLCMLDTRHQHVKSALLVYQHYDIINNTPRKQEKTIPSDLVAKMKTKMIVGPLSMS